MLRILYKRLYRVFIIIAILSLPATPNALAYKEGEIGENNLDVYLDVVSSQIRGISSVLVNKRQELLLQKGALKIINIKLNNKPISFYEEGENIKIKIEEAGIIEIRYEGFFKDTSTFDPVNETLQNVIDERGVSLTGIWYPRTHGLSYYRLKVTLPEGYEAISEVEEIRKVSKNGATEFYFSFPYPLENISLVASSNYRIIKDNFKDIEIYAYFSPENSGLAKKYIDSTKNYIELYENLLRKYPYRRFSIVENFLPTGYSMPTFTLLGSTVIRLSFIVETSLGHEILHQWFGNLVYIKHEKGNWAEGLTTYLADHLYKEQEGKGWEYRKQLLIDYQSYVKSKNDFPLRDFKGKMDSPFRAIGYGKGAFVFHMLKNIVGEKVFFDSLKYFVDEHRFKKASWDNLKMSFERFHGRDLQWFFTQWINEKGLPHLSLEDVKVRQRDSKYEVDFNIVQGAKVYTMDVPVTVYSHDFKRNDSLRIDRERNNFSITLDNEPQKLVLDEDYDIGRGLSNEELPPVVARLLGEEKALISLPVSEKESYKGIIDEFKKRGALEKDARDIKDPDIRASSLIVLGSDNPIIQRLFGKVETVEGGFTLIIKNNPWNSEKVVAIINGSSKEEIDASFRKVFHYGKYSALAFQSGRNIYKRTEDSQRGIVINLREQAMAVDVSALKTLQDIINGVLEKKIIYVGEKHDQFAHHDIQLQVIRSLFENSKKIAIGMEMFQRPFHDVLNDYIECRIDERAFLKKSEYFKRGGYDYNLYRAIIDFAKSKKIPLIALNIRREIIEKVSSSGLDSLSEEEKKEMPSEMDFSDNEYRKRLIKVFEMHREKGLLKDKPFDFFYQSQILWDETMAMSIDEFLRKNPDYQMVVIAGNGHLEYGSGIPKRTFRRNGYDYAIILNDSEIDKGIANYVVFPWHMEGTVAPKLMVLLKEEGGRVSIIGFPEDSISEKAGLNVGDIIISLDGITVSSVDDVRIHLLLYKKKGDTVRMKILRKRFLFGDKEMEIDVVL